ncbi:hypothetical protein V5799_020739 [Amblyomma americanum]|uniref:Methyltransferase type 11 domain-containing protein n=1 Tax=Amblyomma americanum TaxID=6943 RepID=A0AAQ4ET87_AMBAM
MSTSAAVNEDGNSAPAPGEHRDTYGVAKCVEMYDEAIAPVAPGVAALLDLFQPAFLHSTGFLHTNQGTGDSYARHRSQFIDVGCGSGSFTLKYLLPRLPSWCSKLVGVDNSEAMLKFAREKRSDPKIEYRNLDLLSDQDVERFVLAEGHFQMVYSFSALHWIADHRHALKNLETLMAPGGECFLLFSSDLVVFDVFTAMISSPRWEKYSGVLLQVLPETRNMVDVTSLRSHLRNVVNATNLMPLACEVFRVTGDTGVNKATTLDFLCLLNPVYPLLKEEEKAELRTFTEDVLQDFRKRRSERAIKDYKCLVIHAYKPRQ